VLEVDLQPPSCGDGLVQAGEQCDDHNVVAGDGCSDTCTIEGNYIPETEPNDTQNLANVLGAADGFIAAIQPIGDLDYFKFDVVVPGSSAFIQVTDGVNGCPAGFDSKLTLYNPSMMVLATDDNGGADSCSKISPATTPAAANLAVGSYVVRVEQNGGVMTQASYVVRIKIVPPGCGDGVVQPGEQCDDGNAVAGDGCDPLCVVEPPFEIEPNDSVATATPAWAGFGYWKGGITQLGDHDYYVVNLAAPGTVIFTTHTVGNANACPGDTVIHLLDGAGNQLLQDDDGGVFPCSKIAKAVPAGNFYLWVQRFSDTQTIPAYQLDYTLQ
jgi:cysteine-rich repeat protein